jgi:FkbM family methyltransferase
MARTRPGRVTFGRHSVQLPDDLVPDFVNVVLDDDYGLRGLQNIATVVDIGANIGLFSCFAREQFPGATIHAYEPAPATAAVARANTAHALTTLFEEGVSGAAGSASMVDLGHSNLARTQVGEGPIALVSLAQVLERIGGQVDLLKIDCEGAEWDFMTDPAPFRRVRHIRMEYHLVEGRTLDDALGQFAQIELRVVKLDENQGFGIAWLEPLASDYSS